VVKIIDNIDNNVRKGVAALRHIALEDVLGFYKEESESGCGKSEMYFTSCNSGHTVSRALGLRQDIDIEVLKEVFHDGGDFDDIAVATLLSQHVDVHVVCDVGNDYNPTNVRTGM
jgi:hypothetical protein